MGVQSTENVEFFYQSKCFNLCGDALEAVVSKVPTVDLIPASQVSREWYLAVHSSLRHYPRHLPWLLLCQYHYLPRNSLDFSIHAFDPSSRTWLLIPRQPSSNKPANQVTTRFLNGSSGDRLYTLSISKMAISEDPFGARWRLDYEAPKVWRQDSVLAEVGRWVVVAGGGCFVPIYDGEEVRSVEVYDKVTATWQLTEPMPVQFDGSTFATWLSVTASDEKLYVMERKTGLVTWFDPECKKWGPTCQLITCYDVSAWAVIVGPGKRLLVVGVGTTIQSKLNVRIWEVDGENLQVVDNKCEEMPTEMVKRLFLGDVDDDDTWRCYSVEVCGTERGGYVYNASGMRNGAVFYELADDEKGKIVMRWEWVPVPVSVGDSLVGRIEFGCSKVGLGDLSEINF